MALIDCSFYSDVLELSTSMKVLLPQRTKNQIGMAGNVVTRPDGRVPTLYLLHGLSDDDSIWTRRTSLERYVSQLGIAVVMPQVHRSFYTDMKFGGRYWTFLTEELPELARSFFPLSARREDNFVAGLSMGGYGAFKWALHKPEQFAAAASLSGSLDVAWLQSDHSQSRTAFLIFGDQAVRGTEHDLLHVVRGLSPSQVEALPSLYMNCGTEDFLYAGNVAFRNACDEAGVRLTSDLDGPGDHEWGYWDRTIQDVLKWLPLNRHTE